MAIFRARHPSRVFPVLIHRGAGTGQARGGNDVMTSADERQRAAEVAQRYPGWIVWTARKGTPVATRAGNQRPPAKDGTWAQTIIADDWTQLEAQLADQP